jgi:hypothetical protein
MKLFVLCIGLLLVGTIAGLADVGEQIFIPRPCLKTVALTEHTVCRGSDKKNLVCTGLLLTYIPDCEALDVKK